MATKREMRKMSFLFRGHEIPSDVHIHMLEGKTFEEVVADLPNRPVSDIEYGLLILGRHPLFEEHSKMMTIAAIKHKTSKAILLVIEDHDSTKLAESAIDAYLLSFLKECHALCVEFHVRAVNAYKASTTSPETTDS